MSADNITECPQCNQWELREWKGDVGIGRKKQTEAPEYEFSSVYHCECRGCGWEWSYRYGPVRISVTVEAS